MDTYKTAKALTDHVDSVTAHLANEIGIQEAINRVMKHLTTVLQDAIEGGRPDDMAKALRPPAGTDTDNLMPVYSSKPLD